MLRNPVEKPQGCHESSGLGFPIYGIFLASLIRAPVHGEVQKTSPSVPRELYSVKLGMPLKKFLGRFPKSHEEKDLFNPEGVRRVFNAVVPEVSLEIERIRAVFARNILVEIELTYASRYAERVPWQAFQAQAITRYGQPADSEENKVVWRASGVSLTILYRAQEEERAAHYRMKLKSTMEKPKASLERPSGKDVWNGFWGFVGWVVDVIAGGSNSR